MLKPSATLPVAEKLDFYYQQVSSIILSCQDPISGLFPASTDINHHGDYRDAWVRDNVYTIQSVWALSVAYRKAGCDDGRAYLLEQSVVKMMRGLLLAMMRQADKVERFKRSRSLGDALHAKYDKQTGQTVVSDQEWGHLQLDATAIFMLNLAQMIRSGLRLIYTIDEVNFIQNLVYYLGRAYRTPDFGIWERGNKRNDGRAEINASSIGMVKAALESMNGLNLFGENNLQESVVHVVTDEIAQSRITLESLLPRESNSKEVDAALLAVIGFPAFAVEDLELVEQTKARILLKLSGNYGCKRFLLDGHQTVLEDKNRLYYEADELKKFEHIESEWPLFFTYLFIDALFEGDYVNAANYRRELENLCVEKDGLQLLPELYYVAEEHIEKEKKYPGSQPRQPNNNVPLVWAQSLFYVGCLIDDGLLEADDIDPLRRHIRLRSKKRVQVQIALLAEDDSVKAALSKRGFTGETQAELQRISIKEGRELSRVFNFIGINEKLRLTGRPMRRMRALMSSQVYRLRDELVVFIPQFQNQSTFYLNLDNHLLVDQILSELHYLVRHWDQNGKPLITLLISTEMLEADDSESLFDFLQKTLTGKIDGIDVMLGPVNQLIHDAGCETIKELHDFKFIEQQTVTKKSYEDILAFKESACVPIQHTSAYIENADLDHGELMRQIVESDNLYEQVHTLERLVILKGLDFDTGLADNKHPATVKRLLEGVYRRACSLRLWAVIRSAAGLLEKYCDRLDVAVQEIVIRQKQLMVGRSHNSAVTISDMLTSREIYDHIKTACEHDVREAQMNQEVLMLLAAILKSQPELLDGIVTIRTGHLLLFCINDYAKEFGLEEDKAFEQFTTISPYELKNRLIDLLGHYQKSVLEFNDLQSLPYVMRGSNLVYLNFSEKDDPAALDEVIDWLEWRRQSGDVMVLPKILYEKLWLLLSCCRGIVLGDRYNYRTKLETRYIRGAMTQDERSFVLLVNSMLNEIVAPEYRYITVEAIMAIAAFVEVNSGLVIDDYLVLEAIIERALRLDWIDRHPDQAVTFNEDNTVAWKRFYQRPPHLVANSINRALVQLLLQERGDKDEVAIHKSAIEVGQSLSLN